MSGAPPTSTPATGPPPWWAHVLIGAIILTFGTLLALFGSGAVQNVGLAAVGSGLTFLGVGSGVAASS